MFDLYVKTLIGKTITVKIDYNFTIHQIKEQIQDIEGVAAYLQRLIWAGKQLENDKTVAEYNISSNSCLHLVLKLKSKLQVQLNAGEPLKFEVIDTTSLNDLKDMIFLKAGIPIEKQKLFINGELMEGDKPVLEYVVDIDSEVVIKMGLIE